MTERALYTPNASISQEAEQPVEQLSHRELDVLRLLADGLSSREIAHKLTIATSTVRMHLKHIYGKLAVHNRIQAITRARTLCLIA